MREVREAADRGTPVLGICNGFQILTEAGMLPGALLPNRSLAFTCKDIHLRVENNQTIFTRGYEAGQTIRVPVAHHDGGYTADPDTLDRLEGEGRVAFRYCGAAGGISDDDNFNGSARAIAGIFNETRTVLGLMPHPENATDPLLGGTDGCAFFDGIVGALQ
jgi:phosphoribosylformylglycinamidine synthase